MLSVDSFGDLFAERLLSVKNQETFCYQLGSRVR